MASLWDCETEESIQNTHYLKDNIISLLDLVTALTAETTAGNKAFLGIFAHQLRESW